MNKEMGLTLALALTACGGSTDNQGGDAGASGNSGSLSGDFVVVEPGTKLHRTCDEGEKTEEITVSEIRCSFLDAQEPPSVQVIVLGVKSPSAMRVVYEGQEPGTKTADSDGIPGTYVSLEGDCRGDSYATSPHCEVELVSIERDESPSPSLVFDLESSLTLRVSCPKEMVADHGDYWSDTVHSPAQFEITATGCPIL